MRISMKKGYNTEMGEYTYSDLLLHIPSCSLLGGSWTWRNEGRTQLKCIEYQCIMCVCVFLSCCTIVHTFCLRGRLSGSSSACLHNPRPWRSCCPGPGSCPQPRPHVADTWGSLPAWRSTACPKLWSLGLFYWNRSEIEGLDTVDYVMSKTVNYCFVDPRL